MDSLLLQSAFLVSHLTFMLGMHLQISAYRYTSRKERNVDFNYGGAWLSFSRHAQNAQIAGFFFQNGLFSSCITPNLHNWYALAHWTVAHTDSLVKLNSIYNPVALVMLKGVLSDVQVIVEPVGEPLASPCFV